MAPLAVELARWVEEFEPASDELQLAQRSLVDTLAVTLAARRHPIVSVVTDLSEPARWASIGHVLDFDDLHLGSTAHVSVVCTAATLACGGEARAYLAGAGVMARLGVALGWNHYSRGWHSTCTAGAAGAAVSAAVALGLDTEATIRAIALALPAAGGVQRAFGTDAKALQVGFATDAGVRAAQLACAGASADPEVLDQWLPLVGGNRDRIDSEAAVIPGGLAVKLFPCCYAMQRPIFAMLDLVVPPIAPDEVERIIVRTSEASVLPLIHHRPSTGLEGKFSVEYAMAVVILDGYPGFASFTDESVQRDEAQELIRRVEVIFTSKGDSLLSGGVEIALIRQGGKASTAHLAVPPGAPERPPNHDQVQAKLASCGDDVPSLLANVSWSNAPKLLRKQLTPLTTNGASVLAL